MKQLMLTVALAACAPVWGQVKITPSADRVAVEIDGKPFTTLYYGVDMNKPYLHPLRSASGVRVTRAWPMEEVEGEVRDHPHHNGLWLSHGDVNSVDYWQNHRDSRSALPKGKIVVDRIVSTTSGAKSGTIVARFRWVDHNGKTVLTEDRTMTFYSQPVLRTVDLDVTLTAVETAKFGDTKEGMFGIRMATSMDEAHGGTMVNAEGKVGEKVVWGKPSPWVDYWGKVGEETFGITIMDHPSNPKAPTYWHSRAYGLFAANIFGEHDFFADRNRDGSVTVEKGKSLRFRYRVIVHPGNTASQPLAGMYKEWAGSK